MDFQKLMQTMRDIDSNNVNECGEMMAADAQMSEPAQPATDAVPQPNMSVNFNAQGLDNIEGMMKLFRVVNPDMMPKEPAPLPAITAQPALNAEAYDNEPEETEYEIDDVVFAGNDLHKEKGTYPKVAGGDNPMQRVRESSDDVAQRVLALSKSLEDNHLLRPSTIEDIASYVRSESDDISDDDIIDLLRRKISKRQHDIEDFEIRTAWERNRERQHHSDEYFDDDFFEARNTKRVGESVKVGDVRKKEALESYNDLPADTSLSAEDIEPVLNKLKSGEITYEEFLKELEGIEMYYQSERAGEMGMYSTETGYDTHAGHQAWAREKHEWDELDRDDYDDYDDLDESINSDMRDSVLDILRDIQNITSAGGDATDNIADELGDLFSAVKRSDDKDLKTAYSMVRQAAEESPDVQDAAVARAIAMLTGSNMRKVDESSELDEPSSVSKYIKAVRDAIESGIVDPEIIESDFFDQMAAFDVDYDRIADHWDRITGGETIRKTPMQDKDIDRELAGFNRGDDEGVAATVDLDDLESGVGFGVDSTARASKKKDDKDPDAYLYKKSKDEDDEDFKESFKNRLNSRLSTMIESMKK